MLLRVLNHYIDRLPPLPPPLSASFSPRSVAIISAALAYCTSNQPANSSLPLSGSDGPAARPGRLPPRTAVICSRSCLLHSRVEGEQVRLRSNLTDGADRPTMC